MISLLLEVLALAGILIFKAILGLVKVVTPLVLVVAILLTVTYGTVNAEVYLLGLNEDSSLCFNYRQNELTPVEKRLIIVNLENYCNGRKPGLLQPEADRLLDYILSL